MNFVTAFSSTLNTRVITKFCSLHSPGRFEVYIILVTTHPYSISSRNLKCCLNFQTSSWNDFKVEHYWGSNRLCVNLLALDSTQNQNFPPGPVNLKAIDLRLLLGFDTNRTRQLWYQWSFALQQSLDYQHNRPRPSLALYQLTFYLRGSNLTYIFYVFPRSMRVHDVQAKHYLIGCPSVRFFLAMWRYVASLKAMHVNQRHNTVVSKTSHQHMPILKLMLNE